MKRGYEKISISIFFSIMLLWGMLVTYALKEKGEEIQEEASPESDCPFATEVIKGIGHGTNPNSPSQACKDAAVRAKEECKAKQKNQEKRCEENAKCKYIEGECAEPTSEVINVIDFNHPQYSSSVGNLGWHYCQMSSAATGTCQKR